MENETINVVDLTRITAKNMYEMLMELASHVEKLQAENSELRKKLALHDDDLK
jgi:hypothetical protein